MKKILLVLLVAIVQSTLAGCAINHPVAKDYPQFLNTHGTAQQLPKTNLDADYILDEKTQNHRYQFRAVSVGYAHVWIVEFGKILDETLKAKYVQTAFNRLQKATGTEDKNGNLIEFSLEKYEFVNYRAFVTMKVTVKKADQVVFSKTYSGEGNAKGGQMWGAGPFGMKNATLDSTKTAIDLVLYQFLNEVPK